MFLAPRFLSALLAGAVAAPVVAGLPIVARDVRDGTVPEPAALRAEVHVSGRTSFLTALEIARTGKTIPRTFSRHLLGNTEGFDWYVSRHFALKTDLPEPQASEALALLEMAYPHLEAIFGQPIAALLDRRMALVFASSRSALERAMVSDDVHVLRLGGITQEGFWSAYQYAGSPYHSRYIVLHELVHLYQYCLRGTTRLYHGFFIEGVADFFSSHVFDPATGSLTVNVLDRAPEHNHLAAGLAEWTERGYPSFRALYEAADTQRGLDVLMTAFLQSSPEWEQKWRLYCDQVLRAGHPGDDSKPLSDRLLMSLYGDWETLDQSFADWMRREPSFVQLERGFDQAGDTLVSYTPRNGSPAAMLFNPPPGSARAPDAFRRDYPHQTMDSLAVTSATADGVQVSCEISHRATSGNGVAGLGLGWQKDPVLLAAVSNGIWLTLSGEAAGSNQVHFLPRPARGAEAWTSSLRVAIGTDKLEVVAFRGGAPDQAVRAIAPLTPALRDRLLGQPCGVMASRGGLCLTPRVWREDADGRPLPQTGLAVSTRFAATPELARVYRAAWRLGEQAPTTLVIARNLLLARAGGRDSDMLTRAELSDAKFWGGLAQSVTACPAEAAARRAALGDLAEVALDVVLGATDADGGCPAVARLRGPAVGSLEGRLTVRASGGADPAAETARDFAIRLDAGETRDYVLRLRAPLAAESLTISAAAEAVWLGAKIELEAVAFCNPSIPVWHVLGPFPLAGGEYRDDPMPPERGAVDLLDVFAVEDGTRLAWQRVERPAGLPADADHLLHFARLFGRQANRCAAYAWTQVCLPEDRPAQLSLGVADGVRVWVNGQLVHADLATRDWAPRNLRLPVRLTRGTNTILIKSIHDQGLWFLSGRVEDPDGRPLAGVTYR
ncbi:MAG: hypothetical protein PHR35_11200 [Kiritimatiellae bacterium]|nr:hypothetical protein [Kiritimatiellia bacterium]